MAIVVARVRDGQYIDVNPEFLRQSGYSREEVIGRTPLDLNVWVDPLELDAVGHMLEQEGKVLNREVQFRLKSGAVADSIISVVPVMLGGEACVLTLVHDVTQEKQAQQALTENEERYRHVAAELQRTLDLSLDIITTIDLGGEVLSVNAACATVLGYTPEEVIGRSFLNFIHPDDRARTAMEAQRVQTLHDTTVFENRYLHKDGHVVCIEWNAVVPPGESVMYCVARDVTQRRAAEQDQAFLAAIVQASRDAIIGLSLDGLIRSWNPGAEQLYGYLAKEAVGQPMTLLIPPELQEEEAERFKRVVQGEQVEAYEAVRVTKDGQHVVVLTTVSAILDAHGQKVGVSRISQDLRTLRSAEDQVRQLNEDLQRQLRQVTSSREIDRSIASSAELSITLGLILDGIRQQLGMDVATVLLLNSQQRTLEYAVTRGFYATKLENSAVTLGTGLSGQVARSRQPLSVPELSQISVLPAWREILPNEGLTAYYAVPLISKGQVLGVIEVMHHQAWLLSPDWLATLETLVGQATIAIDNAWLVRELERRNLELRSAYDATIEGWSGALDLRDKETEGHSRRVTDMTVELCRVLGFTPEQLLQVRRGALLHDIGKMGIPDSVLLKPGKLSDEEWVLMKKHPDYAVDLLSPITFLQPALDIPQYHHEKWDGSGYPRGLSGTQIPLAARAFAVVDVYDALTSDRPYRQAWSREQTLAHIQYSSGSHFDPEVVEAFIQLLEMHSN